jgi:hypothetical protein
VEISSAAGRFIVREVDGIAYYTGVRNNWGWQQLDGTLSFQSKLTTTLTEDVLSTGSCMLTPLAESTRIHLSLFEPLRSFFGTVIFPFT